jgi:hypothetical protein
MKIYVLVAVRMMTMMIFWVLMSFRLEDGCYRFGEIMSPSLALIMETVCSSETSVYTVIGHTLIGLSILLVGPSSFYTANDLFLPRQVFGSFGTRSPEVLTKIMRTTGDANK